MGTGLFSANECRKRNQQKHRDNGLCVDCSKKVQDGRKYCKYHLIKRKERMDRRKEEIKDLNSYKN